MRKSLTVLLLALLCACGKPQEALPRLGDLPGFRLTGTDGGKPFPVEKRDLLKRPWIASFLFTSCAGPCPALAAALGGLQARLDGRARLVTFSVDPETDTPEILGRYAQAVGAQPGRWWFLTGSHAEIHRLLKNGFKVGAVEDKRRPLGDRIAHSTKLVLVDGGGVIRGYYDSTDAASLETLQRDIGQL